MAMPPIIQVLVSSSVQLDRLNQHYKNFFFFHICPSSYAATSARRCVKAETLPSDCGPDERVGFNPDEGCKCVPKVAVGKNQPCVIVSFAFPIPIWILCLISVKFSYPRKFHTLCYSRYLPTGHTLLHSASSGTNGKLLFPVSVTRLRVHRSKINTPL